MSYPVVRMRRLRKNQVLRDMVAETTLTKNDLIYPMFACEGQNVVQPVPSMPGIDRFSVDKLVEECQRVQDLGVPSVLLFGIPDKKDALGTEAYNPKGIVPRAIREIKKKARGLIIMADVCLCEYTSHGHCGILDKNQIHNDATLELLARASVAYARAGADVVAPSDMMDGRVAEIRDALDENELENTILMSYSSKYCSAFYGPFRDAADSAPQSGDRKSYQMDPRNALEAIRETELDVAEGADMIMVKPAMPYLDILWRVREEFDLPLAAYQVSGEYSMLQAAAQNDWLDLERVMLESLYGIKRAGADMILTYFAKEAAKILK